MDFSPEKAATMVLINKHKTTISKETALVFSANAFVFKE